MACRYREHSHKHDKKPGPIKRTVRALAKRWDVPKSWVIGGFVLGFIISAKLTLIAFLIAWFWSENTQKAEGLWRSIKDFLGFSNGSKPATAGGYAHSTEASETPRAKTADEINRDPFLRDLQRQFDELEKRTVGVEKHVTSDEYRLNNEFNKMRS